MKASFARNSGLMSFEIPSSNFLDFIYNFKLNLELFFFVLRNFYQIHKIKKEGI
jgi:hypothetical protein